LGNFPAATTGAQHDTTIVVIVKATTTAAVIVTVNESKDNSTWAAIGTIAIPSGTAAGEKRLFKIPPRHARFLKLTSSAAQSLEAWFEPGPKNDE
jgi:hypothetical protein